MYRSKRGQASSVFIYVITLVIVAMVLVFGYKAIAKVIQTSDKATMAKFQNELRKAIDSGSSYGKISTENFETPVEYKSICFVTENAANDINFERAYPLGAEVASSEDNAFLYNGKTVLPFKVDPFEIDEGSEGAFSNNALCANISNGRFSLRLEGLGDRTLIGS